MFIVPILLFIDNNCNDYKITVFMSYKLFQYEHHIIKVSKEVLKFII